VWLTYVNPSIRALSSPNSSSASCLASRAAKNNCKVLKDLSQHKDRLARDRWISQEHLFGRNDDVQKCIAHIAVQTRIGVERRRKGWATAGYPYAYQQAEGTAVRTHTLEAMDTDALASAAGTEVSRASERKRMLERRIYRLRGPGLLRNLHIYRLSQ